MNEIPDCCRDSIERCMDTNREIIQDLRRQLESANGRVEAVRKWATEKKASLEAAGRLLADTPDGLVGPVLEQALVIDLLLDFMNDRCVEGERFQPGDKVNYGVHGTVYTVVRDHWQGNYTQVHLKTDCTSAGYPRLAITKIQPHIFLCSGCGSRQKDCACGTEGTTLVSTPVQCPNCRAGRGVKEQVAGLCPSCNARRVTAGEPLPKPKGGGV